MAKSSLPLPIAIGCLGAFITIAILAFAGWVMNIITLVHIANDPIGAMFVLRCVGVFVAPLGAILGWL